MQFPNPENPYKTKLLQTRDWLQRKMQCRWKDHHFSSNGRSSFGKATTKYDMQTSCGLLQQNGWKDLLPYILLTYQILKGVGRESLLTEFRNLYSSVFISPSHHAAPPTHTSSRYSSTNSADNQDIALCHLRQERASSFPRNATFMSRFK